MALVGPAPISFNPLQRLTSDLLAERRTEVPFPPGDTSFSIRRTRRFAECPLPVLLDAYKRYGPVFSMRIFHGNGVFMIGPEANHYMTVSHASQLQLARGSPGRSHPVARRRPADDRRGLPSSLAADHAARPFITRRSPARSRRWTPRSTGALEGWRDGARVDLYYWTRRLALRIAMRALFGFDPDAAGREDRRRQGDSNRASASGPATTSSR